MSSETVSSDVQSGWVEVGASTRQTRRGLFAWSAAATGLLLSAGALRVVGSSVSRPDELTVTAPFPLEMIPRSLEDWRTLGNDAHLDPITTRITGATDHIGRTYFDEATGTTLSVLVLYGPAEPVLPHTPQVCYPASGYRSLVAPADRTIRIDDHLSAVFRAAIFAKSGGREVIRQEVYHSYRLDGVWSPAISDRNLPRRRAGLFKVQIQRRITDSERIDADGPIEAFLRVLLPAIERLVTSSTTPASAPTKTSTAVAPK